MVQAFHLMNMARMYVIHVICVTGNVGGGWVVCTVKNSMSERRCDSKEPRYLQRCLYHNYTGSGSRWSCNGEAPVSLRLPPSAKCVDAIA